MRSSAASGFDKLLLWVLVVSAVLRADVVGADTEALSERIAALIAEVEEDVGDVPALQASALLTADMSTLILIDARTQAERDVSIIAGAITLADLEKLPRVRTARVVVYCTIGLRSGHAARALRARGIDAVNLRGGVLAWMIEGGALVDSAGKPTHRIHVYGRRWNAVPAPFEPEW